jgi:TIR domain
MAANSSQAIKLFICYAREDETLCQSLERHLIVLKRQGLIDVWHDRQINAGTEWEGEIHKHLNVAQIILLLISPDFIASDYCYDIEMIHAMERHQQGKACVIPIILRPTHWQGTPFDKLQVLPTNATPVISSKWRDQDEAFFDIVEGIKRAVNDFCPKTRTTAKVWLSWIITLLFVLIGTIQITCWLLGRESSWSIVATVLAMLMAIMLLFQRASMLSDWPLFRFSNLIVKLADHQLFRQVIFLSLIIAIIAFPLFASLTDIPPITNSSQPTFPPPNSKNNLLINGSFEHGITGWKCTSGMNIKGENQEDRTWIQVDIPPTSAYQVICDQDIPTTPQAGRTYTASIYLRTTNSSTTPIRGGVVLWINNDHNAGLNVNQNNPFLITNSSNWIDATVSFRVSDSLHTYINFEFGIEGSPAVSLDITAAQVVQDP